MKPPYVWPDYDRWYEILLLPNLGHGSFGPPQGTGVMTSIFVDSAWEGTDFDGDGFDDLLIGRRGFLEPDTIIVFHNLRGRGFQEGPKALTHAAPKPPYGGSRAPGGFAA